MPPDRPPDAQRPPGGKPAGEQGSPGQGDRQEHLNPVNEILDGFVGLTALDLVERRLQERTGGTGRGGSWPCPAHDDNTPSLSVTNGNGKVLLHCHAGCNVVDIVTALGLEVADLFDEQPTGNRAEVVATYDYTDENGTLLFQVVRYFPKAFKQRRPDSAGGWVWKLDDTRRVLYRLPEVIHAVDQLQTIYVVEGEKDADRLIRSGEVATCNPGGVGKWRREYTNTLFTAHVVIVADADEAGRKHAKKVHGELTGTAAAVRVVEPAVGKDVCDHFAAGRGVDDFVPVTYDPDPFVGEESPDAQRVRGAREEDSYDDVPAEEGHVVLDAVRDWLTAHVAYQSPHHAPTVALWCLHTHDIDHAASTPRIAFESPEPESGKTRTLELMECVCRRGKLVLQMSPASIYRWVEAIRPTILLDEIDAVFGPKAAKDHEDLRSLVNAGHRRGATVPRVETPSMRVVEFSCFCPVALAGLAGALPDTIRSRSIHIPMRRRAADETVKPFRERTTRPEGEALRRRLEAWVKRHGDEIPEAPELPAGVSDRQADQWEPLIALADAAGGHWPDTARAACTAIVTEARGNVDDQSLGVRLLGDLYDVFDAVDAEALATASLVEKLCAIDEAPWGDLRGKPIDARWLARKVKPYGISPRVVRIGDKTPRGYHASDFAEAFSRYVPDKRNKRNIRNSPGRDVALVADVADNRSDPDPDLFTTDSGEPRSSDLVCLRCGGPPDHPTTTHAPLPHDPKEEF